MTDNESPQSTPNTNVTRVRIGIFAVAALGLASAAIMTTQLGEAETIEGSLNGMPYARAQAMDEAEANRSTSEVIQLTSDTVDADAPTESDSITDDVADTVGNIVSTVGDSLVEVGECILEQLPDVFSTSREPANGDANASACADLLPSADDFGAIDLSMLDFSAVDLGVLDLSDLDATDLGLPSDFDVTDLDIGELADYEVPEVGDELADLDIGREVREVVSDMADEIVDFVTELPGNVRDRFGGLFGND